MNGVSPSASAPRAATGRYRGLSNQGATCYLNSLLQSLYMTPEFRAALYQWTYDEEKDGPKDDCIPYQLQSLFGRMQLRSVRGGGAGQLLRSLPREWPPTEP